MGIYPLTAVSLLLGDHPVKVNTTGILTDLGVDARSQTVFTYEDGKMAVISTAMDSYSDGRIRVHGTKGFAEIDGVANWERMRVYDSRRTQVAVYENRSRSADMNMKWKPPVRLYGPERRNVRKCPMGRPYT